MKRSYLLLLFLLVNITLTAQNESRWKLIENGNIKWEVNENDSHMDNVEMSGFYISSIVHYGTKKGQLKQKTHLVFPMLRTIPNDTHASLAHEINHENLGKIKVNGKTIIEYPHTFHHQGFLSYESKTTEGIEVRHQLFPSTDQPIFIDRIQLINTSDQILNIEIPKVNYTHTTDPTKGVSGSYLIKIISSKEGNFNLAKNESLEYALIYSGRQFDAIEPYIAVDFEFEKRKKLVKNTFSDLVFESPNEIINSTFSFAKLRAVESIFHTKGGLMHAPGGGRYYAAIWANDQAEYANPFFPFLGNLAGNESAINSFRTFAKFMNDEYKPIPSSIIAEGIDFWNGAGDRGDMAMIAYGATRFALANGDKKTAKELWPLIEWCLEYCKRKITKDGVVASDSDELEGRFAAGDANLNTSCLYYDALISATLLGKELNINSKQLTQYQTQSTRLRKAIENFFGANMAGFETYQYFEGNDFLRAWIATPLTVDIFDRSQGTIDALFSDQLWTEDGLASQASNSEWKRSAKATFQIQDLIQSNVQEPEEVVQLFDHPSLKKDIYSQAKFDDSKWGKVKLPGAFEVFFKDLEPDDGVYWFRKKIKISATNTDYKFIVDGEIDAASRIYFNGKEIGTSVWNNLTIEYVIPKSLLKKGENSIAINVIDGAGRGGFFGDLFLQKSSGEKISLNGDWKYKFHGFIGSYRYFILGNEVNKKILNNHEKIKSIFQKDGETTFWDRATLYGFRGALAAGETKQSMHFLKKYSTRRLLGQHVPYPVEAYPEGNQRHLSAESALYCRIITEGFFGIRPTGFRQFSFTPQLPDDWDEMALRKIKAFGKTFDIEVKRKGEVLMVKVLEGNHIFLTQIIKNGEKLNCDLSPSTPFNWIEK
jgi:hypothetical protein